MKMWFLLLFMSLGMVQEIWAKPIGVEVSFIIARPIHHCQKGVWICQLKGKIDIDAGDVVGTILPGEKQGTIILVFNQKLPTHVMNEGFFYAEKGEEVIVPTGICRALGVSKMTILPGRYKIENDGRYGRIVLNVE